MLNMMLLDKLNKLNMLNKQHIEHTHTQVAITVSRVLKAYSNRADLNARMPGFSVQMGFGLHVGWAIEGAIGGCGSVRDSHTGCVREEVCGVAFKPG